MRFAPVALVLAGVITPLFLGFGCAGSSVTDGSTETSTPTNDTDTVIQPATNPMPTFTYQGKLPDSEIQNKQVRISTDKGDIVIALYPDTAPLAVSNFVYLAKNSFYNGLIFHRVISGFMIQGGDPTGTGTGGPGYRFNDELDDSNTYARGTVAMANSGPNTNGSQFFIMHKDVPLPHLYSIFGKVVSGMDVVDAIAAMPTNGDDRPLADQKMITVTVEDVK